MAAHQVLCDAYFNTYSLTKLQEMREALLAASASPERLTGEQLDGVSFQFAPTSTNDVIRALENVACAIAKHEDLTSTETAARVVNSRCMDFSTRPVE